MEKENTNFVGGYVITGDGSTDKIRFNFSKKPNVIHRFFSRILQKNTNGLNLKET